MTPQAMTSISGYIIQEDLFIGTLTVKEHLTFLVCSGIGSAYYLILNPILTSRLRAVVQSSTWRGVQQGTEGRKSRDDNETGK